MITKILTVVLCLILLNSCTLTIGHVEYRQSEKAKPPSGCQPFLMPAFKPIPDVPEIPDNVLSNRNKTDAIMVEKIDELRRYAKSIKDEVKRAYEQHLETCQ